MDLFSSDLWESALEKYAEATGLTVELFDSGERRILTTALANPLFALLREYGVESGGFLECARRCLQQTDARPAVVVADHHGLTVVGTSLVLEGSVVGAAVAGYALGEFSQVTAVQRWAKAAGIPFDRLWNIVRGQSPVPQQRLRLHGELLQVLGDALLRENRRTRQYEDTAVELRAAAAAKDEFLAVLSHELRTPLSAILTWSSVLKINPSPDHVRLASEVIARNVALQSKMVEDLLDTTRIARGTITLDLGIHELSALVGGAMEMTAKDAEPKAIRMELIGAGEPLLIEGDAGRLQQVFRNILSNAIKFTPAAGSIRIALKREGNDALITVTDSGVGIDSAFLPFVFDIFRQQEQGTRRAHPGLGIGLSLVKRLTELHRGIVRVASAGAGLGTEVEVRLPLTARSAQGGTVSAGSAPSACTLTGLTILVIEDSDDSRKSVQLLLEHLGAEVSVARDGREALDMIEATAPDLVLCDLRMPRMDGYEFMDELQHRVSPIHPPVVAMSALASAADRQRTSDAGFEAHLAKPFDEAEVVAAVHATMNNRHHSG